MCPLQDSGRKEPGGGALPHVGQSEAKGEEFEGVKMEMRLVCGEENKGMGNSSFSVCSGGQGQSVSSQGASTTG